MNTHKTIQRANAKLAYLRSLSPDRNMIKKLKLDKRDPLVKSMLEKVGKG